MSTVAMGIVIVGKQHYSLVPQLLCTEVYKVYNDSRHTVAVGNDILYTSEVLFSFYRYTTT